MLQYNFLNLPGIFPKNKKKHEKNTAESDFKPLPGAQHGRFVSAPKGYKLCLNSEPRFPGDPVLGSETSRVFGRDFEVEKRDLIYPYM